MCKLQLSVVVPPEKCLMTILPCQHLKNLKNIDAAKEFKSKLNLNNKSLVVDIGNDGVFLDPIKN